jgi:glyoxylase I family protein
MDFGGGGSSCNRISVELDEIQNSCQYHAEMKIEHVALQVPDPIELADWYVANLGMRVVRSFGAPAHARFLADSAGQTVLEVYNNPKASMIDYRKLDPLHLHIAFAVEDVAATREKLLAAGATPEGEVSVTDSGDTLAMVRDLWGIPVQLVKRAKALL